MSDILPGPRLHEIAGSPEGASAASHVREGLGPWPDFWGDEGDPVGLATSAGLALRHREDATQATLPSYRCFVPEAMRRRRETLSPMDEALLALEALQADDCIRASYLVFQAQR